MDWTYKLTIDSEGKTAALDVDGFQTMTRFACTTQAQGDRLVIFFKATRAGHMGLKYKPGTALFSLERGPRGQVLTEWGAMSPNAPTGSSKAFKRES